MSETFDDPFEEPHPARGEPVASPKARKPRTPRKGKGPATQSWLADKPIDSWKICVASEITRKTTGELFTVWTEVGVAYPLESGKGIRLMIRPGIAVSGTVILFPPDAERSK